MISLRALMAASNSSLGSLIESVTKFDIAIGSGSLTGTDTIASADKSLSAVFFDGLTSSSTSSDHKRGMVRVELTNDTTVTATRNGSTDAITSIKGTRVLFGSGYVKAVHHGTVTIAAGATSAISSTFNATLANCAVLYAGNSTDDLGGDSLDAFCYVVKSGSDGAVSVTAKKYLNGDAATVSFCLIELQSGIANQIIQSEITSNNTGLQLTTVTIPSVDMTKSLTLWGGIQAGTFNWNTDSVSIYGRLASSTTHTMFRYGTSSGTNTKMSITTIEFNDDVFESIERKITQMGDAETTTNTTLSTELTDLSKAFISRLGWSADPVSGVGWNPQVHMSTSEITSTTNLANVRHAAVALTDKVTISQEIYQG